jgi:exodeoxyribonuclease-3
VRLRIMTYNILYGGHQAGPEDRTELLFEVIDKIQPDVLALQEGFGFALEEENRLELFQSRLALAGVLGPAPTGLHLAVFAKKALRPQLASWETDPFHHAAMMVKVTLPAGIVLRLVVCHLNPDSEDRRLEEAGRLATMVGQSAHAIVLGDCNGLSPQDPIPVDQVGELLHQYRTGKGPNPVENRAISRLLQSGLLDLGHVLPDGDRAPTYPTRDGPDPEGPPIRIDYILGTESVSGWVRRYTVYREGVAHHASDHYPVYCDLEIP